MKARIRRVIDYLYDDEQKDYEASEQPEDHIFNDLKTVDEWLESPSCPLVDDEEVE